jgi:hypothetical protein
MEQNYSNHRRFVPGFHFLTSGLVLTIFAAAIIKMIHIMGKPNWQFRNLIHNGILPTMVALVLIMLFIYTRVFALKAQDRAIRSEENLRHYILTGKAIDKRVSIGQVTALRFAADEEFVVLTQQAADKSMSPDEIKKAIKNWRADNHRA